MTPAAHPHSGQTLFPLPHPNLRGETASPHSSPEGDEDLEPQVPDAHVRLLAERIKPLTYKQYQAISEAGRKQGLPAEVATALPWVMADPQEGLRQLRNPDTELIGNVAARVLILNTLNGPVLKALENLRGSELRFAREFLLPPYQVTADGSALLYTDPDHPDPHSALEMVFTQMSTMDTHVEKVNVYLKDIAERGVRTGGTLFPLVVDLPGMPTLGVLETADCYGRVYAAQAAADITLRYVIEVAQLVPRDDETFKKHPWKVYRNKLLAICGKVRAGGQLSDSERRRLIVATMPRTTIVLGGDESARLDEVRRRAVAQAHLEPATPFSATTTAQVRAEAVLADQEQHGTLPVASSLAPAQVRAALNDPGKAAKDKLLHLDEIAVLAVAAFLPASGSSADRMIGKALTTRGVAGKVKYVRSGLAAEVALRHVPAADVKDARRSAFERALRWKHLRGRCLDSRLIPELLQQALGEELPAYQAARDIGEEPVVGDASAQLSIMGAFWLVTARPSPILDRSAFGPQHQEDEERHKGTDPSDTKPENGKGGDYREPNLIVSELATTEHGLRQLAQAIYDGRAGRSVRLLDTETAEEPADRRIPEATVLTAHCASSPSLRRTRASRSPTPQPRLGWRGSVPSSKHRWSRRRRSSRRWRPLRTTATGRG
jgi:hypothetical protein